MLVLSRKISEEIHIGPDVRVVVVEIRGDKVRLGVSAPRGTSVNRGEVAAAKAEEGLLNTHPPAGVFKTGWIVEDGNGRLLWLSPDKLTTVDLSDVVSWRFPAAMPCSGNCFVKVGPEEDAKR